MKRTLKTEEIKETEKAKPKRRAKGEGTIFQNADKKWIARYEGKEFKSDKKSEVVEQLERYKALVRFGEKFSSKMTVREYGEKYLYHKQKQNARGNFKSTAYDRLERTYQNQILPYPIANILMTNLTGVHIQDLIDELSESYSLSTIKKAKEFFSAMISFGIQYNDFPHNYNPLATVELPNEAVLSVKTKKIEIVPEDQLFKFKRVALSKNEDGSLVYRYGPLFVFGFNTGLREGELLALSRDGIRINHNKTLSYHVSEGVSTVKDRSKNAEQKSKRIITAPKYPRSVRNVPLNKEAISCLRYMERTYGESTFRSDLIVTTQTGLLPTPRNLQNAFDSICKKAGIPHYGIHAMRHTFATNLLSHAKNQREVKAVAEIMGEDVDILIKTYLHTEEDGKHDLVNLIA